MNGKNYHQGKLNGQEFPVTEKNKHFSLGTLRHRRAFLLREDGEILRE